MEKNWNVLRGMMENVVEKTNKAAGLLTQLNGLTSPEGYGLTKGEIKDILTYAKDVRNRYGALQIFYDLGVLEELSDYIVEKYMG